MSTACLSRSRHEASHFRTPSSFHQRHPVHRIRQEQRQTENHCASPCSSFVESEAGGGAYDCPPAFSTPASLLQFDLLYRHPIELNMAMNLPPQMQALLDAMVSCTRSPRPSSKHQADYMCFPFAPSRSPQPPGANFFDYIQATLDEEVFPSLSKAFWTQLWIAVVLLVIIVLGFAAGFVIRILRRRTKFMISDGQLTRPDPKVCVPILWSIVAICESWLAYICRILLKCPNMAYIVGDIVLNLIFRKNMRQKSHSVVLGRFWLLLHLPLIVSYILVGSNVLASTPNFRRHFINMNHGALWFNLGTAGIILAMSAGVVPPAIALGDALHSASVGYNNALVIIQEARATGDITRLLSLQESLGHLGMQNHKQVV